MKFTVFCPANADGTLSGSFLVLDESEVSIFKENFEGPLNDSDFIEKDIPQFQPRIDGVIVSLKEEYGYRHWIWETGMTPEALKDYFSNMDPVSHYFDPSKSLPGILHPAEPMEEIIIVYDNASPPSLDSASFIHKSPQVCQAHIFDQKDTWLNLGGEVIRPREK